MLKKLFLISIAFCLFFKPIQVTAADYDADDTEIMMNDENPFEDTRFCGFEKFKQWIGLKGRQQKKIDEQNEKKFKIAQKVYLEYKFKGIGTLNDAKHLLIECAQNACPKSMEWLGILKVELSDNAPDVEKQKYYNDAFSWYVIAFWMQIIKEIQLKHVATNPKTIFSNLEKLVKKPGFSKKRINYFEFINNKFLGFSDSVQKIPAKYSYGRFTCVFQYLCSSMIHNFFSDRKLSVFAFNIFNWGICAKIKEDSALCLNDLGSLFYHNGFLYECACCYRNPTDQGQITTLSKMIFEGRINVDQNGKKFKEEDRNKIAAGLLWKIDSINTKESMIDLIVNDLIKFDSNGKKITKKNKYNIISNLCFQLKTPFSFYKIGNFINSGDISFINGKKILEDEKYDVAADFYRKGKDLPASLYNLGAFIERNKIKKDLYGRDIPEEKKIEVAADLYRQAASDEPLSLYRLGVLIAKGYISKDMNGKLIPENKRYEVAADLYRRSPSVPFSLGNLGSLIQRGIVKKDLFGVGILDSQKDMVAADLYRRSKSTEESLCNLAVLIENDLIDRDLDNKIIDPNQKYEIVADLYRKSRISYALQRLAILVYENKISTDLDNNPIISDFQRNEVAVNLLLASDSPEANYHIALIKLSSSLGNSFEVRKEALEFLMKAALGGFNPASFYYIILENEIESDKYSLNVPAQDQSIVDQKPFEIKKENLISSDDIGDEEDSGHGEEDDFSKIDVTGAVDIIETQKFSDDKNECDAREQKDLSVNEQLEELSLLKRKELKALKKRQREQNKKEQNHKFKKLIRGQLSEEEKKSLMSKPDTNFHKDNVYVSFDKNAQDQWIGLNAFERNKVSALIADIKIGGKRGKPEKLKNSNMFSRRITDKHRLVYQISSNENVKILSCQGHYDD